MKYFLDTSVFIYAAGKLHQYKDACLFIEELIAKDQIAAVIDTETIQEILYHYKVVKVLDKGIKVARYVQKLVAEILSVTAVDISAMIKLMEKYPRLDPRDALHGAVMLNNEISKIISTDKAFDIVDGIERVDPIDFYQKH